MTMNVKIHKAAWKSYSSHARCNSILEKGSLYLYLFIYLLICMCVHPYTHKAWTFNMCIFPLFSGLNFQSFFMTMAHKEYVYCKLLCPWFFNIGRLGTGLCPTDSDMFLIHKFHLWFHAGVAQWLDIALYKALQRIKKAVEIDHLVPVDSSVKYSSSAVDTLAIFYQVQYLWFEVESRRVRFYHKDMGYISACLNTITNRQCRGSIPFSWDMMLCHWVIGSQSFEEMYCPHLQVSKCPRRILVEHFASWR